MKAAFVHILQRLQTISLYIAPRIWARSWTRRKTCVC